MGDQAYPPPSQTRPGYARVANPIHSRYSSADLYAVQHPAPASHNPDFDDHRRDGDDPDSDSDRDSQNGFGTYSDFNALQRPSRESRTLSQAPTLSSLTTAHRPTYEHANSSRYGLKEQSSTLGGGAGETVALPKISRDWDRGEGLNEKNFKRFNKSREKRRRARLVAQEYVDHAAQRWKLVVPVVVAFLVALVLVLYFCIPRVPAVTFRDAKVPSTVFTSTDENPFITSTDPVSYYFNANLILGLDAKDSYVPVHYSSFGITVKLRETGGVIGRTVWDEGEIKVPGKKVTSYEFPIYFSGNYTSTSDPTFAVMKASCAHLYPTTYRAPLNLTVEVESKVVGVVGTRTTEASIANVTCPIEWSGSAN